MAYSRVHPEGSILFVADIHLESTSADRMMQFVSFLNHQVSSAAALYILGDWFTAWPGDEHIEVHKDTYAPLLHALEGLQEKHISVYALHGNHDFLMGSVWAEQFGIQWISDETLISMAGQSWCLLHGDTLCREDVAYQAFRAMVREPVWQKSFLSLPLVARMQEIERVRGRSDEEKALKASSIMDVSRDAVFELWERHPDCVGMIHGHTHRPAMHRYRHNNHEYVRWVLPDWLRAPGYGVLTDNAEKFIVSL